MADPSLPLAGNRPSRAGQWGYTVRVEQAPSRRSVLDPLDRLILILAITLIGSVLTLGWMANHGRQPLPEQTLCVSRLIFGLECPGCGLTRSLVLLGQGRIGESLRMNWLGAVFFLLALAHLTARIAKIADERIRSLRRFDLATGAVLLGVALIRIGLFYLG